MPDPRVEVGVLGMSTLTVDDASTSLSARRMRSLLAVLVLGQGRPLPAERIIDAVWDGRPSTSARNTLQGYVARMRRLLEPDRQPRVDGGLLPHGPGGYQLTLAAHLVDVSRFDGAVARAQEHVSALPDLTRPVLSTDASDQERAHAQIRDALTLWRGDPFLDLGDYAPAAVERRRLEERRVDAQTAAVVMEMMMGRSRSAAVSLEELVAAHPLREQLWQLWAVALVRSDRQAHALDTLARLRTTLAAELGIDPSPAASQLQRDILRQDPTVLGSRSAAAPSPGGPRPGRSSRAPQLRPAASTPTRVPLVGRERELHVLHETIHEVRQGVARHCVLVGDAGMGKSRLTAHLAGWVGEHDLAAVATVRNTETSQAPPLWALRRALSELSAQTGVPLAPSTGADGAAGIFTMTAELLDFLRDVTAVSPVLLVVEDAQWSDPAALEALGHVVEHLVDVPIMVLVSHRPEGDDRASDPLAVGITRSGGLSLELCGLTRADVALLATVLADRTLSGTEVDLLHEQTAGNPLYVVELLRRISTPDARLPRSLVTLIRRRTASLPPATVLALQVAAVLGRQFSVDLVRRSCGSVDLAEALEPARSARLLHQCTDAMWGFTDAVVHEACLESIRPLERGALHARVAEAMDATVRCPEDRIQLVRHWRAAGEQYAGRAWRSLTTAAARARELLRCSEEAQLLADALDLHRLDADGTEAERFWMLERRVSACRLSFDAEGASATALEAIATAEGMGRPDLAVHVAATVVDQLARRPSLSLVDPSEGAAARRLVLLAAVRTFLDASDSEIDVLVAEALSAVPGARDRSSTHLGGLSSLRTVTS